MSGSEMLTSASWSKRFIAYLIDFVVVILLLGIITTTLVSIFYTVPYTPDMDDASNFVVAFPIMSVAFFAYWTILEYTARKTIGKKILGLEVTTIDGSKPEIWNVAVSSFGKAFLLPFDVILGWLFTNSERQRLFSKFGKIIVVETRYD